MVAYHTPHQWLFLNQYAPISMPGVINRLHQDISPQLIVLKSTNAIPNIPTLKINTS